MLMLLKIITFPIWFPIKVLWFISKVFAFVFLVILISILIYVALHFF
jgi:hypothetical protein